MKLSKPNNLNPKAMKAFYFTRIEVRTAPATAPAITAPALLW
jgi:hypothetical protein